MIQIPGRPILPAPKLEKPQKTLISVKHYGDWTNPVEHSHLYRWGADMTHAIKRIQPRTRKKKKATTKHFHRDNKQVIVNELGEYVVVCEK